jgi:hypothetical protein
MDDAVWRALGLLAAFWGVLHVGSAISRFLNDRRDAYLNGLNSLSVEHLAALRRDWFVAWRGCIWLSSAALLVLSAWSALDRTAAPYWPLLIGIAVIPACVLIFLLASAGRDRALLAPDARLGAALAEFRTDTRVRRRGRIEVRFPQLAKKQRVEVVVRLLRYDVPLTK